MVRPATLADIEALGHVHVRCWGATYSHILSAEALARMTPHNMTEMWRRVVDRAPEGTQFLAEVGGKIVGFSMCGRSREEDLPEATELYFIYLLNEHHGSGLGQELFDALKPTQTLWVAADNPRAQAFYRRNGFVADGRAKTEEFFGEPIDEIRLVRTSERHLP